MSTTEPTPAGAEAAGQSTRIGDFTEEEFLAVITPLLPHGPQTPAGMGDDYAVLSFPDLRTAASTDVLVERRHFRTQWSTGRDIEARAAAQNLVDAAAMGVRPAALVVGLVMSASTPVDWVRDFVRELAQGCKLCGAGAVGGDLSDSDSPTMSVMVLGNLECRAPVLQNGARPDDAVVHIGALGHNVARLTLFSVGSDCALGSEAVVLSSQEYPQTWACIEALRASAPLLAADHDPTLTGAISMLDISDGLLRDAGQIARASDVAIDLDDLDDLPDMSFFEPVTTLVDGRDGSAARALARSWLLTEGEDHGLLAIILAHALDRLPAGARVIGRVLSPQSSSARVLGYRSGILLAGEPVRERTGRDHFLHA